MAGIYRFDCRECGHSEETYAEVDLLMSGAVKPVLCHACEAVTVLFHEYTGEGWRPFMPADQHPQRCPECDSEDIDDWGPPHPCPRCGTSMERDPDFLIKAD